MASTAGFRRNLHGLRGEYFIGSKVMSELSAVYRPQPFGDLGIDGEIELLGPKDLKSTGRLLKVQVKTSISKKPYVRVSSKHVDYWKLLSIPVIVCLVALRSNRVYWWPWQAGVLVQDGYTFTHGYREITSQWYDDLLRFSKSKEHAFDVFSGLVAHLEGTVGYLAQLPPNVRQLESPEFERHIELAEAFKKVIGFLADSTAAASTRHDAEAAITRVDDLASALGRMRVQALRDSGAD